MTSLRAARPPQPHSSDPADGNDPSTQPNSVTLGPRDRMIGELYIEGDLNVNGTVEGQLQATGDVDVAQAANVKASVAGREVSISGQVNGAVTASKKLVVERSGSLIGDVHVPRLVIQDGAKFSGNVSMGPVHAAAAPNVDAPDATAEPTAQPEKESAPIDKAKPKKR